MAWGYDDVLSGAGFKRPDHGGRYWIRHLADGSGWLTVRSDAGGNVSGEGWPVDGCSCLVMCHRLAGVDVDVAWGAVFAGQRSLAEFLSMMLALRGW